MSLRDCSQYRPGLGVRAAASGGDPGQALELPDALDLDAHLASCRACRTEVEELALLSFAIRRAWQEAGDLEPPADAWPKLRERVARPRPARRLAWAASSIAGAAMGTALAMGLIAPMGAADTWGGQTRVVVDEAGSPTSRAVPLRTSEDREELVWLRAREGAFVAGIGPSGVDAIAATGPRAVFATVRREQSRYAEDRWDDRPRAASEVPTAIVL